VAAGRPGGGGWRVGCADLERGRSNKDFTGNVSVAAELLRTKLSLKQKLKPNRFESQLKPRFGECCTCFGCEIQTGVCIFWLFFKIGLCSALSFERYRQELSIDVAEHRSILKNKGVMRILVIF